MSYLLESGLSKGFLVFQELVLLPSAHRSTAESLPRQSLFPPPSSPQSILLFDGMYIYIYIYIYQNREKRNLFFVFFDVLAFMDIHKMQWMSSLDIHCYTSRIPPLSEKIWHDINSLVVCGILICSATEQTLYAFTRRMIGRRLKSCLFPHFTLQSELSGRRLETPLHINIMQGGRLTCPSRPTRHFDWQKAHLGFMSKPYFSFAQCVQYCETFVLARLHRDSMGADSVANTKSLTIFTYVSSNIY